MPIRVLPDDAVRALQYLCCGPVVLVKDNDLCSPEVIGKVHYHAHVGPPPPIYGLVRIPDHHYLSSGIDKTAQKEVLGPVHILVFVDQYPVQTGTFPLADLLVSGEDMERQGHQVVKVQCSLRKQMLSILFIQRKPSGLDRRSHGHWIRFSLDP